MNKEVDAAGNPIVRRRSRRRSNRRVDHTKFGANLDAIIANEKRKKNSKVAGGDNDRQA